MKSEILKIKKALDSGEYTRKELIEDTIKKLKVLQKFKNEVKYDCE